MMNAFVKQVDPDADPFLITLHSWQEKIAKQNAYAADEIAASACEDYYYDAIDYG